MKAVIQRVENARLSVDGECVASVGRGLAVYVGVEQSDVEADIIAFAQNSLPCVSFPTIAEK